MTDKIKHHSITILILGIFLIGCGSWFILNPQPIIAIPEIPPLIYLNLTQVISGESNQIEVFPDGTILQLKETGLKVTSPDYPGTRIWRKGNISADALDDLIAIINTNEFKEMSGSNVCQPKHKGFYENNPLIVKENMQLTLCVNCETIVKTITAFDYVTPDYGMSYPDMPPPLNTVYATLRLLCEDKTIEMYREKIESNTVH